MISVVIPCYNRGALLARAIDSALAQGTCVSEIIVVDDGSTDQTKEVCARYGSRVRYVWQENAGPSVARNTGVSHARFPWVAFLDSDDYWTPSYLTRIARAVEETNGEASFYFSDMQIGEGKNCTTLWKTVNFAPPERVHLTRDGTNWVFLRWHPMMLQSSVFRRDVLLERGCLDPRLRLKHDSDLFFRLSVGGKICAVSGVGCVWTDDVTTSDGRLTTEVHPNKPAHWEESIELWRRLVQEFPNLPVQYRRVARNGLASSHWRLFRLYLSLGNLGKAARHLPMVAWSDPSFVLSLIAHGRSDVNPPAVTLAYD